MILVTGATGQFGSKAIEHLIRKQVSPIHIIAMVRDVAKAKSLLDRGIQVRVGDYTDVDSLIHAFQGVDKLLLVSSSDRGPIENRTTQHINAIKAAQAARVKHITYTSFIRKADFAHSAIAAFHQSHVESEAFLKNSGVAYTILQNGMYQEMIPVFAGQQVGQTGLIFFPAGNGQASYVLREELAEAAAHVLTTDGHLNQVYQLTNTASVSFYEIARELSHMLEKEVIYQSPSVSEFEARLKSGGVPDQYIGMFTMWAMALSQATMDVDDPTLAKILGRKPTSVQQFLHQAYGTN
ncbi:SDR family oxidoreductase [Spirosoma linguale]|uniref:NmrA family protein n=1 Tax=Spirosoma linguale (strain ATCC 33905 / DSM 74 / LMG 10896 / Claus 1) TaxID=504472 RepID=D2QC00_SPILD|nr:NmrA family protein [Spirosoma linguale DSM 74]